MEREKAYKVKREKLERNLLYMKAKGYRVFEGPKDQFFLHNYGLISDGRSIIYVQLDDSGTLFTTTYEYMPSRKTGSGCQAIEPGYGYQELTEKAFLESVAYGSQLASQFHAQAYKEVV